jgi:hypothetical protein
MPGAQLADGARRAARLPVARGLVAEGEPAREEPPRAVAQAPLVAQPPAHDRQDEIGRQSAMIEGGVGLLVDDPRPVRQRPVR